MASACVNNISLSPLETNFQPTPTCSSCGWFAASNPPEIQETAAAQFELRLEEEPVTMLPADELFSDGKLVPSQETPKSCCREVETEISGKASRSSSRWRGFLGLKKTSQNTNNQPPKSLKHFLNRSSKSSSGDSSLNLPLLKDSDNYEPATVSSSSRLSLSSSSSSHEHEDLPRRSLDSEKPSFNNHPSPNPFAPCRMRTVKPKPGAGSDTKSPRMNSSGKIMFRSLERSSANVRVTPVLNLVPLRGSSKSASVFGFFSSSSQQKSVNRGCSKGKQSNSTCKTTDGNQ